MAGDDDFELWLGRMRSSPGATSSVLNQALKSANLAGGIRPFGGGRRSAFTGSRIGRGSGVGRVLASRDRFAGARSRRVIVKARIVKLGGKGARSAVAHLRYLQRDGTTRDGQRGSLYDAEHDIADGKAFLERGAGDRHQFRFIVAPEDGAEYDDLKPLTRRLMEQVERDLGTRLDWVAVDHFNTGHPHSHIIVKGTDDRGKDLIIAREYLTRGFRERAAELVNLDLGPRTDREILRAQQNEIGQERFTGIDRRLIAAADERGLVRADHRNRIEQSARAGRLQTLGRMGLATEERKGQFRLDPELEPILRRMGERGDIIKTIHREMTARKRSISPSDYALFDPAEGKAEPVIGRIVARGLSDEHADRHYLIVDGIDGRSRYIDIGRADEPERGEGMIVKLTARPIAARQVDRTVADIAAANRGRYDVDIHLKHDATATERFAEAHVRRLEAIRRATGGVDREPSGTWIVAPDHLARAEAYERRLARQSPVIVETLSTRPLEQLAAHDGATWLDRELSSSDPLNLGSGFGADTRKALGARLQWLVEQQLAEVDGEMVTYRANMIAALQQRELRRVAGQLSRELGLRFDEAGRGEHVEGIYRRPVQVGDTKFALIEKSREFTLVPWRPVLERNIGKQVSGIVRDSGISWTIGRSRGIEIG